MPEDDEISIKLSLREWRVVTALVEGGIYRDVQPTLYSMYAQVNVQIIAARDRAAAVAVQAELRAAEETHAPSHPEKAPDDTSESQSSAQRAALH